MNYENHIKEFKIANVQMMQYLLSKQGGLDPMIVVLVKESNDEMNIVAVPVPGEFLHDDQTKDVLAGAIPSLLGMLAKQGKEPVCFSFSSEAWLRKTPEGVTEVPDNWKDLPKTECMISSYESANASEMEVFEIIREGKMANENGDLIDAIVLRPHSIEVDGEKPKALKGRFFGAFQEFYKMRQNEKAN
jgi:hypothetical protein